MKKVGFFASFFRNISKMAEASSITKIGRNHGILVYKKRVIKSDHRKIIFYEILMILSKCLLIYYMVYCENIKELN